MYQIDLLDHQEKSGFRVYIRSLIYIIQNALRGGLGVQH
jgi:hypothetical protein